MTLFFAEIDVQNNCMRWLNAGHEPAIVYDPETDEVDDLSGDGHLPLGIVDDAEYTEAQLEIAPGQIVVIATDGIREAHNRYGEMFGKDSLLNIIRQNASASAADIVKAVFTALDIFQYGTKSEDDMTLVVVKMATD